MSRRDTTTPSEGEARERRDDAITLLGRRRTRRRNRTLARIVGGASLLVLVAIVGLLAWSHLAGGDEGRDEGGERAAGGRPPAVVTAAPARRDTWRLQADAVGTVQAFQGIEVTAEIAGKVVEIAFDAGSEVEPGDPLVSLDTSGERAELRALSAQLSQARSDLARYRRLIKRGAIARSQLEQAETQVRTLQAQVAQQETNIAKKTIVAPFAGRLGIRMVSVGQLISPGTPIVSLQALTPALVNFTLPERRFSQVRPGQRVVLEVPAWPDRSFEGRITAIDPGLTVSSRSFNVQATVANEAAQLRPGMFADVVVDLGQAREVVAVPATAITFNAYGESVFVVEDGDAAEPDSGDNRDDADRSGSAGSAGSAGNAGNAGGKPGAVARRVFVETGERRDTMIEVLEGLAVGQRVVTAGQLKVTDGAPLIVSEAPALARADAKGPPGGQGAGASREAGAAGPRETKAKREEPGQAAPPGPGSSRR